MNNSKLSFLFLCLLISLIVLGQTSPLTGRYGSRDARIRAQFGGLPDEKIDNIIALKDLHTTKILFATIVPNEISYTYQPFFGKTPVPLKTQFDVKDYIDSLLVTEIKTSNFEFAFLEKDDVSKIPMGVCFINGELKIKDKQFLPYIKEKYNATCLVVFVGGGFGDFLMGSPILFDSQGVFFYGKLRFVYAGYRIGIFSLRTGEIIDKGYSIQASADFSIVNLKKDSTSVDSTEIAILNREIKTRLENNVIQTIKLLKINN